MALNVRTPLPQRAILYVKKLRGTGECSATYFNSFL